MADLVVGLARSVVEGALTQVQSAIDEEVKLRQSAQRNLVFITGEFEMMQSFLHVANVERAKNNVVKTWVRQVRDVAYDVEDCIEFVIHLDEKSDCWCRFLPGWMVPDLPLDKAVAEIEQLRAKVEDVSLRNWRYSLISDSGSKPAMQTLPATQEAITASALDMLVEDNNSAKKQQSLGDLTQLIDNDNSDIGVISVWGTGGDFGRTLVIRKAYEDPQTCHNFGCRGWVKLTHPFNPQDFFRSLVAQFNANCCRQQGNTVAAAQLKKMETMAMTHGGFIEEFTRQVKEKRFLLVIEDVCTMGEWDAITACLPDTKKGSRVIVSTEHLEIAALCIGHPYEVLELKQYSPKHRVHVFFKEVSQGGEGNAIEIDRGVTTHIDTTTLNGMNHIGVHPSSKRSSPTTKQIEAWTWLKTNTLVGHESEIENLRCLSGSHVISISGVAGAEKLFLIRNYYCDSINSEVQSFEMYGWVNLFHPFILMDFSRSLLWEISSDATQSIGIIDPVQQCHKLLHEHKCLVIIDGLQSDKEWNMIQSKLACISCKSIIIFITTDERLAAQCVPNENAAPNITGVEATYARQLSRDESPCDGNPMRKQTEAWTWLKTKTIVGRESQMNELRQCVSTAIISGYHVISVWGIAGAGKSFLIRNYYYDRINYYGQINKTERLFEMYGWVDLSHPFNLMEFSRSLLGELSSDATQSIGSSDPIKQCRKLMHEHKCLVVIDDLQSVEEWDLIQSALLSISSKSIIIVITTQALIAKHCAYNEKAVLNVKGLEATDACQLFKVEVFRKNPKSIFCNEDRLRELILRCGGLPKVIVAIADFLAPKTVGAMSSAESLSNRFIQDLEGSPEFVCLRGLFDWMHSFFRACPKLLQPCIFYLSMFPEDQSIRRRRLVMRWVAEGYCRDTDDSTAEENGEQLFAKLVELSMIQQTQDKDKALTDMRMVWCRVSGFFHEYVISQPKEENIIFALEIFTLRESCRPTTRRTGRHLVIDERWDGDEIVFESIDFSRLRSLTVFGEWRSFLVSKGMKVLRVLDLENASGVTDEDLEVIVALLPRLKFLSVRGNEGIFNLPSSLGDLRQLQTLDVRGTSIITLPESIINLRKLQYIRAGSSSGDTKKPPKSRAYMPWYLNFCTAPKSRIGVGVPEGTEKLTALHTLGVVSMGAGWGNNTLKMLKKLTQLRKLGVSGVGKKNSNGLFSALSGHPHLQSLSVWLNKDNHGCSDGFSSHCAWKMPSRPRTVDTAAAKPSTPFFPAIESLKLRGLVNDLPQWVVNLPKLKKLDLEINIPAHDPSDVSRETNSDIIKVLKNLKELCPTSSCECDTTSTTW